MRHLCWLALVFAMSTGSAEAENCLPDNLYVDYWDDRDIFATMTRAEREEMPSPRAIAQKWADMRDRMYLGVVWKGKTIEEFTVVYKTHKLIELRKDAWEAKVKASPARAKQLEACRARNKVANQKAADEAKARDDARKQQSEDEHFAKLAKWYRSGEQMCLNDNCRICKDGTCTPVGKRRDQPSCAGDRESYRCNVSKRERECKANPDDTAEVCLYHRAVAKERDEATERRLEKRREGAERFRALRDSGRRPPRR